MPAQNRPGFVDTHPYVHRACLHGYKRAAHRDAPASQREAAGPYKGQSAYSRHPIGPYSRAILLQITGHRPVASSRPGKDDVWRTQLAALPASSCADRVGGWFHKQPADNIRPPADVREPAQLAKLPDYWRPDSVIHLCLKM